jgi:plasmid stabilization system protein ParE
VNPYQITILPRARLEAMESFRWLAQRSPAAAARWFAGLEKAIAKLAENPQRHPIADEESERFGFTIRQSLYGRRRGTYRILYTVEGDTISVLAIRHSARGPLEP